MISRLEINNFRNHRSTRLDFEPLTVIAGPNGVGKSNALRALNWFSSDWKFLPGSRDSRNFELYGKLGEQEWKAAANLGGNWIEIATIKGGEFREGKAVFSDWFLIRPQI